MRAGKPGVEGHGYPPDAPLYSGSLSLRWEALAYHEEPGDQTRTCLLYTSDAADERSSVDLGGRRIIKKKNHTKHRGVRSNNKENEHNKKERRGRAR